MSKDTLTPQIRFPEFAENWEINTLSDMCDVYRGGTFSKADMDEDGSFPCIHYGELFTKYNEVITTIYSKTNKSEGFKSEVGDILMPSSDVTPDGLAKASAIMFKNVVLGGDMNIIRPNKTFNSIFLSYLLNHSKKEIIKLVSGTTVKHIYPSQIITCQLPIVNNKPEQEKIATCLSSLDEVIAALSQKLELLKDHKKGLMQNLFPREGEKVPKFRFREFEKDGEWDKYSLINISKFRRGSFPQPYGLPEWYDDNNGMPFIQVFDVDDNFLLKPTTKRKISKLAAVQSVFIPKGTVIITIQGSIGRVAITQYDAYIDRTLLLFEEFYNKIDKVFFAYVLFMLFEIEKEKAPGGIIKTITKEVLSDFIIKFPDFKEQQKIASCLSSLDALIMAQEQKIEQLKLHKKGMMQSLFPKIQD